MNLLPQQTPKKRELTPQQTQFLDILFENGGNVTQAAVDAGYSKGSAVWLRKTLAEEIVDRTTVSRPFLGLVPIEVSALSPEAT